jgi:hypothetical protein
MWKLPGLSCRLESDPELHCQYIYVNCNMITCLLQLCGNTKSRSLRRRTGEARLLSHAGFLILKSRNNYIYKASLNCQQSIYALEISYPVSRFVRFVLEPAYCSLRRQTRHEGIIFSVNTKPYCFFLYYLYICLPICLSVRLLVHPYIYPVI